LFGNKTMCSQSMYLVLEQNLVTFLLYSMLCTWVRTFCYGLVVWIGKKLGWKWMNNRCWYRVNCRN
jgi:hypothetical protein